MIRRTRDGIRKTLTLVPAAGFLVAGVFGVFPGGVQPAAAQEFHTLDSTLTLAQMV